MKKIAQFFFIFCLALSFTNGASIAEEYLHPNEKAALAKYGRVTPPNYNLKNIKAPVSLHYSMNDWLSHPKDVDDLYVELPNSIGKFRVPHDLFNHLDFLFAKDMKTLVYDKVLRLMLNYKD